MNKAIIVAHPDDEILWFSSQFKDASDVVVCFSDVIQAILAIFDFEDLEREVVPRRQTSDAQPEPEISQQGPSACQAPESAVQPHPQQISADHPPDNVRLADIDEQIMIF